MSDYPMLISNKLHSFRNFIAQTSILSVPERPSTVYSVFPALRPFRNGNKNPRKCTFYICEPMLCTINAANFTRKQIFPEIMCISCVN